MIQVFFNEDGYYIAGEGIEISRRCSPALTENGDRIFQPLHHEYKVLYLALCELRDINSDQDIIVCGSSRIIDEVGRIVEPLDDTHRRWFELLNRHVMPSIKPIIFCRKKSIDHVRQNIFTGHENMLHQIDQRTVAQIVEKEEQDKAVKKKRRNQMLIEQLRQNGNHHLRGEDNGNRT